MGHDPGRSAPPSSPLLSEFPPASRQAWEQEIARTLEKQGKAGHSLDWQVGDGVVLPPFFMADDVVDVLIAHGAPGAYPFTRSTSEKGQNWSAQLFLQGDGSIEDRLAEASRRGADGVTIAVGKSAGSTIYGLGRSIADGRTAASSGSLLLHFVGGTADLLELGGSLPPAGWSGSLFIDPFHEALLSGDLAASEETLFSDAVALMKRLPAIPVMAVRADIFHAAGAMPALELGLTLAAAGELTQHLVDAGLSPLEALSRTSLFQPAGPLYFVEIAKFRATRRLAALLARGFGIESYDAPILPQAAVTSLYNASIYDPYTNMLRACTSSMSAVLGGATSLVVLPVDAPFGRDDEFSRRMALNTQLVLRHESLLDQVADPAGGSYYIEQTTERLAEAAWKIFLDIEAEGGYYQALLKGTIQDRLEAAGKARRENLARRKEIKLGVNQYPSAGEVLVASEFKDALPLRGAGPAAAPSGRFRTVWMERGAAGFEALRLATEEYALHSGHRPLIQLLPFGNLTMQRARAAFIGNFFGCAGFAVNDPGSLDTPAACVDFARSMQERVDAFVLCAADGEYGASLEALLPTLAGTPVLIAGNPADADALKSAGIDDFIHLRLNVLETLTAYQKRFCR